MRQLAVLFMCGALVLSAAVTYAAPVGNIAAPKMLKGLIAGDEESQFGIVLGPEVDFVFDRNYENQVQDTEYGFYGGKAGIVIGNKAVLYGLCGTAVADQEFWVFGKKVRWETDLDIAWGGGATLIVYEKEITVRGKGMMRIGIDGRYRISNLDVNDVKVDGTKYAASDARLSRKKFNFEEWQVALELSYQPADGRLIPYGGVKYLNLHGEANVKISGTEYNTDLDVEDKVGIFAGCDVLISDSISAYAEGRFIDETALSAGATIRF